MKSALLGFGFGLIAPLIGLFVGLQLSIVLANILMWPVLLVSMVTSTPFGMMSSGLRLAAWLFSAIAWSAVFYIGSIFIDRLRNR